MDAIVVDIDDTIVNTNRRRYITWCKVLGREIPFRDVESSSSEEILEKYGDSNRRIWEKFWMVILCVNEIGVKLLELDKPILHVQEILKKWSEKFKLIYLTARTENMRQLTLYELGKFGFPTIDVELKMFELDDWKNYSSISSVVKTRSVKFAEILTDCNVFRVVDDYPDFFQAYNYPSVPDRIGLLRGKRFSKEQYFANGATRVIESWDEL
ncbi:MAG: hypothetical protein JSV05_09650 [Candidatus Bathyarchaeota archaeon]|nr:MAG: hypothetical protein JSV05_09650 [Candidatus Bathyarchaeota archaeon]